MRFDSTFLYFRGRQVRTSTAQKFLCENYPHLLTDYIVKREVKNERVILHIDWQGVFGQKFFQLLIYLNETTNGKGPH
jgi:hypothetical protein